MDPFNTLGRHGVPAPPHSREDNQPLFPSVPGRHPTWSSAEENKMQCYGNQKYNTLNTLPSFDQSNIFHQDSICKEHDNCNIQATQSSAIQDISSAKTCAIAVPDSGKKINMPLNSGQSLPSEALVEDNETQAENVGKAGKSDTGKINDKSKGDVKKSEADSVNRDKGVGNDDIGSDLDDDELSDASTIVDEKYDNPVSEDKDVKKKCKRSGRKETKGKRKENPTGKKYYEKQDVTCEECGKILHSLRALDRHKNLHTGVYKCEKCDKVCNSESSLKSHSRVHDGYEGDQVCNVCGKNFYDKSSLNKHTLSVHMGIKNFHCRFCSQSFYARKTYEEHERVHTGERPFKCNECPKSYKRISDLNHHIRLHRGEVKHTCEQCGDGFRRISELNRHKLKHSSDNPDLNPHGKVHKCEYCAIIFSTKKALTAHTNTHIETTAEALVWAKPKTEKEMVDDIVQELGTGFFPPVSEYSQAQDLTVRNNESFLMQGRHNNLPLFPRNLYDIPPVQHTLTTTAITDIDDCMPGGRESSSSSNSKSMQFETSFHTDVGQSHKSDFTMTKHFTDYQQVKKSSPTESVDSSKAITEDIDLSIVKTEKMDDMEKDTDLAVVSNEERVDWFSDQDNVVPDEDDVKQKIEMLADEVNEYGGDTDVEDYNCTLSKKDSTLEPDADTNDEEWTMRIKKVKKSNKGLSKYMVKEKAKTGVKRKRVVIKTIKTNDKGEKDGETKHVVDIVLKKKIKDKSNIETSICEVCGKVFLSKIAMKKHMHLHKGTFTCGLCSKSFTTQASLTTHMDVHEGRKEYTATCNVCDRKFYDYSSLHKHVKSVHMGYRPFPCPHCERRFPERKGLAEHIRVHTGERPFKCTDCDRAFKRKSELNFHVRKAHTNEQKYFCSFCGKGFLRLALLRMHVEDRHGSHDHRCKMCRKNFQNEVQLQDHRLRKHPHTPAQRKICDKCGHSFYNTNKLNRHLKSKTNCAENSYYSCGVYSCRICMAKFDNEDDRSSHLKEQHPEEIKKKSYPCNVCGKTLGRSQALKLHMKIHYQIRDYQCSMCSSTFVQKHHLLQHMRTHTGEKPYQCHICLRSFAQSATLYSHMKHHDEKLPKLPSD
ncbi:ZFP26-like protein, partial [Mya arenaria]